MGALDFSERGIEPVQTSAPVIHVFGADSPCNLQPVVED
jgi:hypothetical protein